MTKKYEDFLFDVSGTKPEHGNKIQRFSEYRKGSSEYGTLFQDLMMILRLKKEENREADEIILSKEDLKNIDLHKLVKLLTNVNKMRKLGMSFDAEIMGDGKIRFYNLNNKESRPWENIDTM